MFKFIVTISADQDSVIVVLFPEVSNWFDVVPSQWFVLLTLRAHYASFLLR